MSPIDISRIARSRVSRQRTEIISAIADLAVAAQAGTLARGYQREWSWVDKQNFIDAVDADEFNENFHGIEREFDKLADLLSPGGSMLPVPWDSGEILLSPQQPYVLLNHNLNTMNLLVDLQVKLPRTAKDGLKRIFPQLRTEIEWWAGGAMDQLGLVYVLPDPNSIIIGPSSGKVPEGENGADLYVRVRAWQYD